MAELTERSVYLKSLRDEFESNKEWRLRRKFLDLNFETLSLDRLICQSKCFINVTMYGCTYPEVVMREIDERSGGILVEMKEEKKTEAKQKYAASFVRASNDLESCPTKYYVGDIEKPDEYKKDLSSSLTETEWNFPQSSGSSAECFTGAWSSAKNDSTAPETNTLVSDEQGWDVPDVCGYWNSIEDTSENETVGSSTEKSTDVKRLNPDFEHSFHKSSYTAWSDVQGSEFSLSKEECLTAFNEERNPVVKKIRKLAFEVHNAKDLKLDTKVQLHEASHRVPVVLDFKTESISSKTSSNFVCHVILDKVILASGNGQNKKLAKTRACEAAMKIITKPRLTIDPSAKRLQVLEGPIVKKSQNPGHFPVAGSESWHHNPHRDLSYGPQFINEESLSYKESNKASINLKRKWKHPNPLEEFIIVEQINLSTTAGAASILRQSADFNHMLLEYEFFPHGDFIRCIVKIEGHVMADVLDSIKSEAKLTASARCLKELRKFCWVLKTKQAVDSNTSISKEEIQKEIKLKSDEISHDNIGNKMLQKMGWAGGGVGKHGTGIAEPVSLLGVLNREGLGLSSANGITDDFRKRIKEVVQSYALSGEQEDLVFSCDFSIDERKIIHDECRKLRLSSKSRGKGDVRYLCVSRKRSANQLFDHVMSCGGETAKYKLIPPGSEL